MHLNSEENVLDDFEDENDHLMHRGVADESNPHIMNSAYNEEYEAFHLH